MSFAGGRQQGSKERRHRIDTGDRHRLGPTGPFPAGRPGKGILLGHHYKGAPMSSYDGDDDENGQPKPVDPEKEADTGITGGGGPASVIYGDDDKDQADEAAEEMLKAPDEGS